MKSVYRLLFAAILLAGISVSGKAQETLPLDEQESAEPILPPNGENAVVETDKHAGPAV